MSKKLKNYNVLVKALDNFSLVSLDINVLNKKGENVFKKIKESSAKIFYDPYLSFIEENKTPFTLKTYNTAKNWKGTIEYSLDTQNWNEWNGTEISSSNDGKLYLRGTENAAITGDGAYEKYFVLSAGKKIQCIGNIETLLDYKTVVAGNHPTMAKECFLFLFKECASLTKAPELPATTLSEGCYQNMFIDCASLTEAPELPATTLAKYCYFNMFDRTALKKAPELPATTLAEYCYSNMFDRTLITEAPELPATTLAKDCYRGLFQNCKYLTKAPKLPAITLTSGCYAYMFSGCTALDDPPELPATTLAGECYKGMFSGCTRLNRAPQLPVTTLANSCYGSMFSGCTALTVAPELPATTLMNGCYTYMFKGCASLTGQIHCPASTASDSNRLDLRAQIPANTATVVYDL